MADARDVDGILVLYHFSPPYAATVVEHADAFRRFSAFPAWNVNTDEGFPDGLAGLRFKIVLLHYSLFGSANYMLTEPFLEYLRSQRGALRMAFFQDEYAYGRQRNAFLDEFEIDWIYTLLEPEEARTVYGSRPRRPRLSSTLTGYVSDDLVRVADRFARPMDDRPIDVGYRARPLPYWMGRGAREKSEIGHEFRRRAGHLGLTVDIATDETDRLYGDAWYRFLGQCKAVLGVEAGVSIFDTTDEVRLATEALLREEPGLTFDEVSARILARWEDNIFYRTVSPRHFEAAAFGTCQILFEGSYSGVLEADRHYIPLRKDFANLDEVIAAFRDPSRRDAITAEARRDLIDSGRFSYETFVRRFDAELRDAGYAPPAGDPPAEVGAALGRGALRRRMRARVRAGYRRLRERAARLRG